MLNFVSNSLDSLEAQIKQSTRIDATSLCLFRVVFGLFTLFLRWPSFRWLSTVPDAFYNPPIFSLSSFLAGFPHAFVFYGIDFCLSVFIVALLIGLFTRFATVALLTTLIVANSFQYSLGKIDHGGVLYLCVLLVMSFQDWGRYFSVDSLLFYGRQVHQESSKPHKNLYFLALLIAFSFFTAGFGKALAWVDFDLSTSGFLSWLYSGYFSYGRTHLLAPFIVGLDLPLLWELIDYSAVLFELGFLLAMFWRRAWYVWLALGCFFHLSNSLLLNIPFNTNAIAYLAFIPWSQLGLFDRFSFHTFRRWIWLLLALWATALALSFSLGSSFSGLAYSLGDLLNIPIPGLVISCVLWIICLSLFIWVIATGKLNYALKSFDPNLNN
ncbi:hypothetical protein D0962_11080 [Leptolyngbyaceae cyanobacterium CCMR0082]|uniref:HTTM-like domain-containing protein n=2 Tax=Adonisia turfae TaxID=2950184 RepID=A0A6M0S5R9_9CYAN|nr:hypothetical protein [Adonisia turfae]NEZ55698.1 hypothetical protein [Adonisia turfae CCMR0081]NEZ63321.1 hypothetical protein [Adonisia turfae CCMR0082]